MPIKPKSTKPLWIFEPFLDDPGFVQGRMFSFDTAYLDGRMYLAIGAKPDPWNGLFVATDRDRHAALIKLVPVLTQHPILSKWLYIAQSHPAFESTAIALAEMASHRHPLIGIDPKPRKRKATNNS